MGQYELEFTDASCEAAAGLGMKEGGGGEVETTCKEGALLGRGLNRTQETMKDGTKREEGTGNARKAITVEHKNSVFQNF